jgi:CxxC motif-containing protein (DUF1111 family)
MSARCSTFGWGFLVFALFLAGTSTLSAAELDRKGAEAGRELFTREWLPHDARGAAGDGLGPVFNDTSCVGCHNQGGVGGAGPPSKNVQVVTAFSSGFEIPGGTTKTTTNGVTFSFGTFGVKKDEGKKKDRRDDKAEAKAKVADEREQLEKIHPGFLSSRSVVLHRFSTDAEYTTFRDGLTAEGLSAGFDGTFPFGEGFNGAFDFFKKFNGAAGERGDLPKLTAEQSAELQRAAQQSRLGGLFRLFGQRQIGNIALLTSERATPPLFGMGQIDAIPDRVLTEQARKKHPGYPEVSGRFAKLKDGRLGRFGWKGQKASLRDFVLNACATELGLDVPGEPQSRSPHKPDYVAPGNDLTEAQCDQLVSFVAELPAPAQTEPKDAAAAAYLDSGRKLFGNVGCATCHTPDLGEAKGIYSDLLLHDMGASLGDIGAYGSVPPNTTEDDELKQPLPPLVSFNPAAVKPAKPAEEAKLVGALRQEWRTPPLWGLRDSAPYLHDGRAGTIEQAIALHDGEAARSARQFFQLSAKERQHLTAFLRSLTAPN